MKMHPSSLCFGGMLLVLLQPSSLRLVASQFKEGEGSSLDVQFEEEQWSLRKEAFAASRRIRTVQRLLAVRVSSATEQPEESVAFIQGAVFGIGAFPNPLNLSDVTSVVAQFAAISHEQYTWVPATAHPRIHSGVLDLTLSNHDTNITFAGTRIRNITALIVAQTEQALGVDHLTQVADHVLFCLPSGSLYHGSNASNWTAFTSVMEPYYSYYQKSRCTRLSVVIHEVSLVDLDCASRSLSIHRATHGSVIFF